MKENIFMKTKLKRLFFSVGMISTLSLTSCDESKKNLQMREDIGNVLLTHENVLLLDKNEAADKMFMQTTGFSYELQLRNSNMTEERWIDNEVLNTLTAKPLSTEDVKKDIFTETIYLYGIPNKDYSNLYYQYIRYKYTRSYLDSDGELHSYVNISFTISASNTSTFEYENKYEPETIDKTISSIPFKFE